MKVKQSFILALIVNILIRIPRMITAGGLDGFLAIWEAQLILNGKYFHNGFSISTLLGLTPYSGYPIGMLLILSFFLLITGKHIMISILLYDLVFTVIFVFSVYYLSSNLELKDSAKMYFIFLLTTLPNIFLFSYYSSSARYPFIALLPIIFAFLLKFNKEKKIKYLIFAVLISIVLNFIHRMAIILFGLIILSLLFFIIDKMTKKDFLYNFHNKEIIIKENEQSQKKQIHKSNFVSLLNYFKKRFWIFGLIGLYTIGFIIFGLDFNSAFYAAKFNIYCYIKAICDSEFFYLLVQPIVDQWFHYGIPFLLFLASIVVLLIPKFRSLISRINKTSSLKLIYYVLPFVLIYQLIYSFYFLCYIIAIICTMFIQFLEETKYRHYFWAISGLLVGSFITLYHYLSLTKVLPYLIIGLFIIGISILTITLLVIKKTRGWLSIRFSKVVRKWHLSMTFFVGMIVFNSMFIVDRSYFTNRGESIYEYITQEEIEIADFLNQNGFGTFDSFDNTVSVHIAALSGWYFIQDQHSRGVFLIENRTNCNITCTFTFFSNLASIQFFDCDFTFGRDILYNRLFITECYKITAVEILKTYNIRFFISSRHYNTSYAWQYIIDSAFIKSLYSFVPVVLTTDNYFIWNTSTLYS